MGYIEKDDKLLKKNLFLDSQNNEQVMVLIADDYSMIVIFKRVDTTWEFIQ